MSESKINIEKVYRYLLCAGLVKDNVQLNEAEHSFVESVLQSFVEKEANNKPTNLSAKAQALNSVLGTLMDYDVFLEKQLKENEGAEASPQEIKAAAEKKWKKYFSPTILSIDRAGVLADQVDPPQVDALLQEAFNKIDPREPSLYALYHQVALYGARLSRGEDGIALFDENRINAAVAICKASTQIDAEQPFLMIRADIGGIQQFIYRNIDTSQVGNTQGLSKRLRGRSFYISILTEFLAERFVKDLKLEQANLLFVGGGNFTLLAPNTDLVKTQIKLLEEEINLYLRNRIDRSLSLRFAQVAGGIAILQSGYGRLNEQLELQLQEAKYKRHQAYLKEIFKTPEPIGPPPSKEERERQREEPNEYENIGQKMPYSGKLWKVELNEAGIAAISKFEKDKNLVPFKLIDSLQGLGVLYFLEENEQQQHLGTSFLEVHKNYIETASLLYFNTMVNDFDQDSFPEYKLVHKGFKFVGHYAPRYSLDYSNSLQKEWDDYFRKKEKDRNSLQERLGDVIMFDHLAQIDPSADQLTYKRLGVMRLDIDDLGGMFSVGIQPMNLYKAAALSRELHLFFSGHFNELAKVHHVYLTYSGGDDAFVVGSWMNIMHFAEALKRRFDQFVLDNPGIHFSAGILFCNPHYPVAKFAEDAADLEKTSKEYRSEIPVEEALKEGKPIGSKNSIYAKKNAITLFGQTFPWKKYLEMMQYAKNLDQFVDYGEQKNRNAHQGKQQIRRSMIQRLLTMIQATRAQEQLQQKKGLEKGQQVNIDVEQDQRDIDLIFYQQVSRLHYLLARHGFPDSVMRATGDEPAQEETLQGMIKQFLLDFSTAKQDKSQYRHEKFEKYVIPTQYILYKSRSSKS